MVNNVNTQAGNGWNEWSKHVLAELERLNGCYEKINTKLLEMHTDIAILKVKAGVWGIIGGCIPIIIALAVNYLKG